MNAVAGSPAREGEANNDAEQLTEFGRCKGRQRASARRICPPRQRRRRVQALRDIVHDDPRSGHPRAGYGHLRRGPLLARAAHPDQPELQAFDGRRHPGCERRPRPWLRRHLPRERSAAVPLQAPGTGHRARCGERELRGDDRDGIREIALLLHPHRQPRAGCTAVDHAAAHTRHRRLPDERARQLPDGRTGQVHRPGAGRAADHVRPLHGAGGQGASGGGLQTSPRTSFSPTS